MCCCVVESWTAGHKICLCLVLSGCLDFSTHSLSSPVTDILAHEILGPLFSLILFSSLPLCNLYLCSRSCSLAVMQSLARKNEWPLDKVNLTVDVTKKFKEEFNQPAREGAYVYGLYMEGR